MADRLTLIMELGAIATDAAQRGDDRAAATLRAAAALLFEDKSSVDKIETRRRKDRESREVKKPRIPRTNPPKSSESAESAEIVGGSQGFSPTPPFPNSPTQHDTPRASVEVLSEADNMLALSQGLLLDRMGPAYYVDVEEFLARRPRATWHAWIKEMLTALNGRALPEDVAAACRDDATLDRRVSSAKPFRFFINSAVEERLLGKRRAVGGAGAGRPGIGQRAFETSMEALKDL